MRISRGQYLLVIDPDAQIGDLFLDMAKTVRHAGRNYDDVSRGNSLYLAVGHRAPPAGPDEFAHRRGVVGKFHRIRFVAAGNQDARTGQNVIHLGQPVMQDCGYFLAFGAGAHATKYADRHVQVVADIDDSDLLIDRIAQIFEHGHDLRIRNMGCLIRFLGLNAKDEGKRHCGENRFQDIAFHSFCSG